ncbi:hypothetical protein C8J56DRAFT_1060324 [Mycena floridula]|nr:hypothetical protein C8J56DRAFT_1060324 [Mycena floridula]
MVRDLDKPLGLIFMLFKHISVLNPPNAASELAEICLLFGRQGSAADRPTNGYSVSWLPAASICCTLDPKSMTCKPYPCSSWKAWLPGSSAGSLLWCRIRHVLIRRLERSLAPSSSYSLPSNAFSSSRPFSLYVVSFTFHFQHALGVAHTNRTSNDGLAFRAQSSRQNPGRKEGKWTK